MDRDPDKLRNWQRRSKPLETKKGLKPGGPLKRSTPLKSTTPLPNKNQARVARRQAAGLVYGAYHRSVTKMPCWLAGHSDHQCRFFSGRPSIEGDHLKTIAAGGKDEGNEWPVCPGLHSLRHQKGPKWIEQRFKIDLSRICKSAVPSILNALDT